MTSRLSAMRKPVRRTAQAEKLDDGWIQGRRRTLRPFWRWLRELRAPRREPFGFLGLEGAGSALVQVPFGYSVNAEQRRHGVVDAQVSTVH